ncbi:hypothetical protein V7S43_001024 [Phytophthora oleae]|uniref:Uncharacterized protein n=1 Tax=Phytophthora oleae TaxID=2107226 RepID=A0ABD3G2A7_9STRA
MLFLPLEEDSPLFRLCLYYGALVLLLELLVPLLFQRRVRIEIPRLALRAPVVPLSTREFQHRRLALQQQLLALQRALEGTARRSPQKRRQTSLSAVKQRVAESPSSSLSPLASPKSSVKVTRPKSSHKNSGVKQRMDEIDENEQGADIRREEARPMRQRPMAMSDSLATRTSRSGGFSFDEVSEEEKEEENQHEQEEWEQAVNTRPARRRESPTFSGMRPVRLVDEVERVGYSGPSEAAARLEALIGARRRQKAATSTSHVPPPPVPVTAPAPVPTPTPVPVAPAVDSEKPTVHIPLRPPKPTSPEVISHSSKQHDHQAVDEDEETKESEPNEVLTDFQAFCASFVTGGSVAALQAVAKRKHHEAFGSDVETNGDVTQEVGEKRKHPRVHEQSIEDPVPATAATPPSVEKRTHYEAFGSDDEKEVDDVVAAQHVLEKRRHDQAFGTTKEQKQQEKTPRIVRRISFSDEVDALNASPSKEVPGESSTGKRTHKQAFAMHDDEDEDADWRDSLAFRPHHFG